MNSPPRKFQWTAILWRWLVLSILIPTFAIFARWVVRFAFAAGSEDIPLLDMLRESEVTFLAAVILTETLGNAPHVDEDNAYSDVILIVRMTLLACMVLCFLMFGVIVPLTQTESVPQSLVPWIVPLNAVLLTLSVATSLVARRIYWSYHNTKVGILKGQTESQQVAEELSLSNDHLNELPSQVE